MPRHPDVSTAAGALPPSIFAKVAARLVGFKGETFPFHLGDTHLLPPEAARLEALEWARAEQGGLYRYASAAGDPELVAALAAKLRARNGLNAGPATIQVTAGATHAFYCALRMVLEPGDEVLLLSPYWPLVRGQIHANGGRCIEVPFSSRLYDEPDLDVAALIRGQLSSRTVAVYLTTPNNPDGKVLDARVLAAVAQVACEAGLWVLADEVYEDYAFDGRAHVSIASLPGMEERTLTVFSFSKSYGQAGLRVGYIVGPEAAVGALRRLSNHSIYNVPVPMQRAALGALSEGAEFLRAARRIYVGARDRTVAAVRAAGVDARVPEGGSYVFVDFARLVGEDGSALPVLERLAEGGVLLAPGDAFGKPYARYARLCYTALSPERLDAGLETFARIVRAS